MGKNAALKLAARGTGTVITWQHQQQSAQEIVSEITANGSKAAAIQLDVSLISGFTDFKRQLLQILNTTWQRDTFDYLINNAGTGLHPRFPKPQSSSSMP